MKLRLVTLMTVLLRPFRVRQNWRWSPIAREVAIDRFGLLFSAEEDGSRHGPATLAVLRRRCRVTALRAGRQAPNRTAVLEPSNSAARRRVADESSAADHRRVEVTEAGRLFLQEARDIIARADYAAVLARRMGSATARQLRVGIGYCTDQLPVARQPDLTGAGVGDFDRAGARPSRQRPLAPAPVDLPVR